MKNLAVVFILIIGINFNSVHAKHCNVSNITPAKYSFNVEVHGNALKSILFIPGFACAGNVWDETVEQFEKTHRCHVLTLPGFAGVPASENPDWDLWRKDIADYLVKEELSKLTVVGHSLGGMMALDLASNYPELIGQVVVVDALPALSSLNNPYFESKEDLNCQPIIDMMENQTDEQFKMMQQGSVHSLCLEDSRHNEIVNWSVQSDRRTLGKIFCQLSNLDLRNQLDKISCPTLVLLEAPFKSLEVDIATQYKKLDKADLRYAPKGLHFIMYDAPLWFANQLKAFIL